VLDLSYTFRLNTRLFLNATDGITETDAQARPGAKLNSIAFLAAHLVDVRYYFAREIGNRQPNPVATLLADATTIEDVPQLPTLVELRAAWQDIAGVLAAEIAALKSADADRPLRSGLPFGAQVWGSGLAFLLQHEMYHIGQIALLRRQFGYPAMRWSAS